MREQEGKQWEDEISRNPRQNRMTSIEQHQYEIYMYILHRYFGNLG